jgi:hypothetical protein
LLFESGQSNLLLDELIDSALDLGDLSVIAAVWSGEVLEVLLSGFGIVEHLKVISSLVKVPLSVASELF